MIAKFAFIREEIVAACFVYGNANLRYFQQVVASWRGKPRFDVRVSVTPDLTQVLVTARGEFAQRFDWIDQGTGTWGPKGQPYLIEPRGDYPLKFQTGHNPKTAPGGKFNQGNGQASGDWVTTYGVMHPGIEPRDFSGTFAKNARPTFKQTIENAIRRGARRA